MITSFLVGLGASLIVAWLALGAAVLALRPSGEALGENVFPSAALNDIAERDYAMGETVAVVFAFYLVMFVFIEVPLVGYATAPRWTNEAVNAFNRWLDRNGRRLGLGALVLVRPFVLVRGTVRAL